MTAAKDRILETLAVRGPLAVAELPRRWPVTRETQHLLLLQLEDLELVRRVESPRIPAQTALEITSRGLAYLAVRPQADMTTIRRFNTPPGGDSLAAD
jgi:DNA-binding HxlR family transcriptional regulator